MSRYYQLRVLILIIPIGLLFCSRLNAATRTASASGNWNSTTTWGGSAVPTSADAVVINSGVTVTVNVAAVCASINFTTGSSGAALLTISGTNTLTVSGNVTVQRPSSTSLSNTLAVNAGSLSCVTLAIQATTSTRISTVSLSTGTITATGNITTLGVSSRVTFTGAGLISVNGTFMSGTAGTLTAATGTVRYNASGNQTIGNYSYYNLTLAGSGTKTESSATVNGTLCMEGTATISGTITYGANATLKYNTSTSRLAGAEWFSTFVAAGGIIIDNTGTITLNAAKVVNSPLVIASGSTLASGNYNLTLSKDITNDGTFIPGSATVTFNGSSNQNLAGESAILFNNITINNTAGITFSGTANEIVNGTLTLSNGIISTGSNVLQMGNSAIISGAGSTKYINGNLEKGIPANTVSIQFEVGDSQDYAPLTITFSGNTNSAGTITASTNPTDHPSVNSSNIDPTLSLNRYWTLENNNVTGYTSYNAVFTYNATELDGGANYNDFIAGMYSSASWTYPLIDNMTSSTLEVIELTEFGDYQFGESAVSPIACGYDDNGSTPYVADIIPCINIASNPITISSTFSSHQYFTLNVIKGITYEVYTCNSTSPNNQITLSVYREGNAADPSIAFSYSNTGNPCTSSANNAYVTFTPEFSGMVRVLINRKYFCTSTQLSGLIVMLNVKGGSNTLDDQSEAGNEDWIGHLYEGTNSGVAYTGNFSNYLGYYTQTETFNETFGGGTNDVDCFAPILSEGTERGSLKTITYSIRYRMNSSRRGLYTVDLGSDDGSRLAIDGALAYNNWSDQAYSSRPRVLISLTGNSSLVYDFNENAGASRVTFQNLSLVLENILSTNNNQNICLGNSGSAISGDVYGSLPVGVSLSGTGYQWTYSTEPDGTRITISGATASTYTPNSGSSPFNTAGTYYLYRNATLSSTNNVSPNPYVATNESNAAIITVSALPVATFSYTGSPYCKSASDPTPTFNGGGVAGTFSSTAGLVFVNTTTGQIDLSASTAGTYTVTNTIASSGGCSAVISTSTITINPVLTAGISIAASSTNICSGTVVSFTATPSNGGSSPSYQWKVNGVNVGSNSSGYSSGSIVNNDVVSCVITSNATCITGSPATSNLLTITVNPNLPASVSIAASATTICAGTNVTFTATPANGGSSPTYQWKVNGSNVGTNSSTYSNSSLANGNTVTCVMTSNATCATGSPSTSNTVTMTVNPNLPVSVSVSASATTICSGTNVIFTATPTNGGSSPSYQWKLNGSNVGTNSTTYSNSSLTNGNTITCQLTSNATCATGSPATSNTVTMVVNPNLPVSISIAGSATTICSGTNVTFTATPVNGGSTPSYQWKLNGSNVGTSSSTYTNSSLVNNDVVTCILTSNATCATSSPATSNAVTMTVNPNLPVSISVSASSTTICSGTNVTFTATPTNGGSSPSYQWKLNGSNMGTNSTTYSNSALANGNTISCVITSNATCATGSPATSNTVTMTVNPVLPASVAISASSNPVCSGTSVTFTATPTNGGSTPTYQWKLNGNNVGTNSTTYSNSALVNSDIVSCVLTSNATCVSGSPATSNSVTMTVNPNLPVSVTVSASATTICSGTNVTYTATAVNGGAAPTYQWKLNGSVVGTNSATYSNASLVNGDQVKCELTSNATCATGSPASSNLVTMTVNPNLPASVTISASSTNICSGTSVTFTAVPINGGASPVYQWKLNGNNTGSNSSTYTSSSLVNNDIVSCIMTSNATCATGSPATSNAVSITVNPILPASVSVSASSSTICSGTSVTFTATPVNGGATPVYSWKVNGSSVGTNSSTFTSSSLVNNDVVSCIMTSNAVCVSGSPATSNQVTMTVNPNLPVSISIAASATTICPGTSVTFTATPTNGGSSPGYQWKLNGSNVGTNTITYVNASLANNDQVSCVLTSNATCATGNPATSNTVAMTVNPNLVVGISISASATTICSGTSVTFTAVPTNGGSSPSYQWKLDGTNVGTNSSSYSNSTLENGDIVNCVMTSNIGCATGNPATSNSITMTVNPNLPVSVSISVSENPICSGSSTTFTATPVNGGTTPGFQWQVNGSNVGSNSATYSSSSLVNNDVVSCILTSNATCATGSPATSNSITMTVNPNLPVSVSIAASSNPICSGTSVTFTATPTNGGTTPVYQWKLNGVNVGTNNPVYSSSILADNDAVTCVLTSDATCATGNPATSNSITMTVNPNLPVSVSIAVSANPICSGSSATFSATPANGGASPTYQWKVNGTNAGTNSASFVTSGLSNNDVVSCILTSNATCSTGNPATSNPITMTVNPNLPVSVLISSDPGNIICSGGSVTFTAAPTNGGSSPGYQWKKNGVNVGANSTSYTDATLVNADAITCILTSNLTCTSGNPATSNSIGMTVNQTPTVPTSILSSPAAIYSDHSTPITLTASGGGGSGAVLTWYTNACGSGSPVGTGSPLSVDPPSVTTTYYARWENGTCYSNCVSTTVTVYANYRSKANGDWDKAATWEIYRAGTWVAAAAAPTSLDGTITICSPYTVTVTATAGYFNVDEVTIDAGGKLTINVCPSNWWFNIMNGPGTDITINGIMEYQDDKVSMASGATMLVGSGGKFQHNLNYSGNYPITVPTATWDQNSTYEVLSSNQLNISAGMNQSFGHFTWNSTGQTSDINLSGGLTTVNGNFSVLSTGTKVLYLTNTATLTFNIGNDLIIQDGILDFSSGAAGTKVLNLSGNYLQTGGIFRNTNSGALTFNFKGAGKTFTQSGGALTSTYINWDVASTASLTLKNHLPVSSGRSFTLNGTLDCGLNAITGAGTFTMNNAAKLIMGSPAGITNISGQGNIQSTACTFGSNCDFEYNGVTAQFTGNRLPSIIRNLIIGNSNGVSLTNSTLLNGQLALQSGEFILGNMSFTLQNTDIPILKTEGTISTSPGSNLSFGSPGNISGNAFVIPDNIFSTNPSLNNFSIHRANSLTLNNQEMSVYGTVLSNGPLNTNNNLTLKSTASQTALIDGSGSGNITGTVTVERYIPSGFGYKYISSPFQTMTVGALSEYVDLSADFPTFYRYEEDRPASGWISYTNPSGVLFPMTGYAINLGESMTPLTLEATGSVNNNLSSSLSLYNHNQTYTLGFNLVGNPYPSPVDWNSSNGWTRTNIDNAIYYFNAGVTDQYSGTYSSYVNGISSDGYADNVIPAMQGFFIHVTDGSYPVQAVFGQDNRVRVNNLTPDFHKGLMQNFKPLVRLSASYSTNPDESDYLAVYFEQGATPGFDAEYDALKLLNTDKEVPNIFTLNTSGEKLSINAFSSIIDSSCIIPVGVKSAKSDWLDFKPELVEMLPPGMKVFLADDITGEIQQVDEQFAYHVFVSEGESLDRFSLIFSYKDISHIPPVNDQLNAYYSDHKLKVYMDLSLGSKANLIVSTMLGQQVFNQSLNGSGTHELDLEVPTGIYLISLYTSKGIISRKIFISNL